jgi:multiple antibiotic resistance protein
LPIVRVGGGVLAPLVVAVLPYLAFRHAQRLLKPLGEAGAVICLRLSAFVLLCLGVQIIWDGVYQLAIGVLRDAWLPTQRLDRP